MQFEMFGRQGTPYIILLGPALCTLDVMRPMAERLAVNCRVLAVTYDGHDQGDNLYKGPGDQAIQIMAYLRRRKVKRIRLIAGLGTGAPTAVELDRLVRADGSIEPGRVLCDGGYFRFMSTPRRAVRWLVVKHMLKKAREGTLEDAEDALMRSLVLHVYSGGDAEPYRGMMRSFILAARKLSRWSERRLYHTVLSCRPHSRPEEAQRSTVYVWSNGDNAALSRLNIRNQCPFSLRQLMSDQGHLGFFMRRPDEYELLLRGLANVPPPAPPADEEPDEAVDEAVDDMVDTAADPVDDQEA